MTTTTTYFDMSDVRSHVLEIPFTRLALFTKAFWIALLIWSALVLVLTGEFKITPVNRPFLFYAISAAAFLLVQWVVSFR